MYVVVSVFLGFGEGGGGGLSSGGGGCLASISGLLVFFLLGGESWCAKMNWCVSSVSDPLLVFFAASFWSLRSGEHTCFQNVSSALHWVGCIFIEKN